MKRKSLYALLLAGAMFVPANVKAEDDVYVDLSVLDSLGSANSPRINNQLLFPEGVKTAPKAKAPKAKKAVKKAKAKPAEKKEIAAKPVQPEYVPIAESAPVIAAQEPEDAIEPKVEAAPVVAVVAEPQPENAALPAQEETSKTVEAPVLAPESKTVSEEVPAAPAEAPKNDAPAEAPKNEMPQPLVSAETVPAAAPAASPAFGQIRFDSEETGLTEGQQRQLDEIVSGIENVPGKRIAIYAYNFDDGTDSFKKKRQSLNRAMEVRSYLMDKGYRAFSVKVVNTTDDSSKKNLVTVEELN